MSVSAEVKCVQCDVIDVYIRIIFFIQLRNRMPDKQAARQCLAQVIRVPIVYVFILCLINESGERNVGCVNRVNNILMHVLTSFRQDEKVLPPLNCIKSLLQEPSIIAPKNHTHYNSVLTSNKLVLCLTK